MAESTTERIQPFSADKNPSWLTKWPEPIQRAIRKGTLFDVSGVLYATNTGNKVALTAALRSFKPHRADYLTKSHPRPRKQKPTSTRIHVEQPAHPTVPLAVAPPTAKDLPFNFPARGNNGPLSSGVPG